MFEMPTYAFTTAPRRLSYLLLLPVLVIAAYHLFNDSRTCLGGEVLVAGNQLRHYQDPPFKCDELRPAPKKKIAVIAATTPTVDNERCAQGNQECSYAFYLPLTALAWRRLGFETAVILAGDDKPWKTQGTHLNSVYETLVGLGDVTVLFLPSSEDLKTAIAQVGRLFVADMEPFASQPDAYLVTSDADLFPIANIYDFESPQTNDVRLTNGHCCGSFEHNGEKGIRKRAGREALIV